MKRITMGNFKCKGKHIQMVINSLAENYLTAGPYIEEFEDKIAKYHGKKYGVFVSSGQAALEVALELAKVQLNNYKLRVLVPSTTYLATVWAVINSNCIPVFVDIEDNFIIDANKHWEPVDVAIPVDLCGYSAHKEAKKIKEEDENIFIVNDACEAVGNKMVGYGDITCVSFFTSHIITTGYGGMVLLDDSELVQYARSYISHGRTFGGDFTKFKDSWKDRFKFDKVGSSLRESSLSAALGLAEFDSLEDYIRIRKANANQYRVRHVNDENFIMPNDNYYNNCIFQFMPIVCRDHIDRTKFLEYLYEHGVDSRVLLSVTNQAIIKEMYGDNFQDNFPVSKKINEKGFLLPCHHNMIFQDVDKITSLINSYRG